MKRREALSRCDNYVLQVYAYQISHQLNSIQLDEITRLTEEEEEIQKHRNELQQKVIHDMEQLSQVEAKLHRSDERKHETSKPTEKSASVLSRKKIPPNGTHISPDNIELFPVKGADPEVIRERYCLLIEIFFKIIITLTLIQLVIMFSVRRTLKRRGLHPKSQEKSYTHDIDQKKQKFDDNTDS